VLWRNLSRGLSSWGRLMILCLLLLRFLLRLLLRHLLQLRTELMFLFVHAFVASRLSLPLVQFVLEARVLPLHLYRRSLVLQLERPALPFQFI
jgi:hypothetical protein